MTKSELKTGMIVTTRNGCEYVVFRNTVQSLYSHATDIIVNAARETWNHLLYYNEDLTYHCDSTNMLDITFAKDNDIIKVECPYHPYGFMDLENAKAKRQVIWKRTEIKEITMEEIEEKFGCKVKIINN